MIKRAISEDGGQTKKTVHRQHISQKIMTVGSMALTALSKNPLKTVVRIVITAVFVYFVNKGIRLSDIKTLFNEINITLFIGAFFCGVVSLFFQLLRWRLILISHRLPSEMAKACKTMFWGFLLAFVTPGRLGELFRAIDLDKNRKTDTIVAVVEERLCAVIMIVIIGILCSAGQNFINSTALFFPMIVAMVIFVAVFTAGIFFIVKGESFLPLKSTPLRHLRWLPTCIQRWKQLPVELLALFSFCAHLLLLLQTAFLFKMFGEIDLLQGMLIAGQAYAFMLLLPFFIANIGLREYSFSLFLSKNAQNLLPIAASTTVSFGAATVILLFNIMIPAAVGMGWMYLQKRPVTAEISNEHLCVRNDSRMKQ